jgi:hypothetical protein
VNYPKEGLMFTTNKGAVGYLDDEVQDEVMTWFKVQAADFYDSGIQRLVP